MNEVEAVARAVHEELSHIDVMKYLDMPDNTADRVALAAIAALDAARGDAEPDCAVDAWLAECTDGRVSDHTIKMLKTFSMWAHAHPPAPDAARGDPVARVVAYLRETAEIHKANAGGKKGESYHHMRACTWAAEAIERGEPFNG